MKYLTIFVFVLINARFSYQASSSPTPSASQKATTLSADVIINGKNETIPDVTEINSLPPEPTSPTTSKPITTPKSTIPPTTSTIKPTTSTPKPTTSTTQPPTTIITSTTAAPSTITPNISTTAATTVKPVDPTTAIPEPHRRFDGPSFVGGIVLALGLAAIGFVAFKFYKARTESNYHTL